MKRTFEEDLQRAISFHGHLCGGQLTGVRMARYALNYFGIEDPDTYRDLVVYVECDRCLTDAIMTVTNCHPGKRRRPGLYLRRCFHPGRPPGAKKARGRRAAHRTDCGRTSSPAGRLGAAGAGRVDGSHGGDAG